MQPHCVCRIDTYHSNINFMCVKKINFGIKIEMFLPCPCLCDNVCNDTRPIVWARTGTGYRIENLQKKYFNLAAILIKQYYFNSNVLLNALGMECDKKSGTNFIIHALNIMNAGSSLLLIDDRDDTIAGVLLLSVVDKLEFGRAFSHSNLSLGRAYEESIELRNSMQKKIDVFLDYKIDVFLRFYLLCIADDHRGKQLGYHLLRTAIEMARHMHLPIGVGIFTSAETQHLAKKLGFEVVDCVNYNEWFLPFEDEEIETPDPRHSAALMIAEIPPFYESPIVYSGKVDIKDKKGKKGKKKKKDKQKGKKKGK